MVRREFRPDDAPDQAHGRGAVRLSKVTFEPVATGHYLEALLIDGDTVWYTDVVRGGVRRVVSDEVLLPDRPMIGGLLANHDRRLLVAGLGGIAWVDPVTGTSGTVIDGLSGTNEMRSDGRGGLYFGEIDLPAILRGAAPSAAALWHLSPDLDTTRVADGLAFTNGLAVSPGGDRLYLNESFAGTRAWALAPDGSLGESLWQRDNVDCDGMALDGAGNLWVTGFASDYLLCLDPNGQEVDRLALPGGACTNVRFAGADLTDMWVTVADAAAVEALKVGETPPSGSSTLYRGRGPVTGAPIASARLELR